jgi:hypothetical protein
MNLKANTFRYYYLNTFTKPGEAFKNLISDPRLLSWSFWAVFIMAMLYTFVYVFLIFGGGQPFKPWLDIPLDVYYRYNVFFCAPSMFLGWILAAGIAQLFSRAFSGAGTFEQTLSVLGFGIGIASWSTGLHDVLTSFLGAIHVISQREYEVALNTPTIWRTLLWIQMIAYLIWFIFLFSKGIKITHSLKNWQSIIIGITSFFAYQFFFLIFNR